MQRVRGAANVETYIVSQRSILDKRKRCSLRRRALIRAFTKRFTNEIDGTLLLIVSRRFISTMVISSSSTDRCRPDCLSAQGSRQSGTCQRALAWQARSMPQRWRGGQTLTATARDDVSEPRVGTKKRALKSNKETNEDLPPWLSSRPRSPTLAKRGRGASARRVRISRPYPLDACDANHPATYKRPEDHAVHCNVAHRSQRWHGTLRNSRAD
jgi:hypothetical protein